MKKNFNLVIDEPVAVTYGKVGDNAWGHVQFPAIFNTINHKLLVAWEYCNDTIEYKGNVYSAVSDDGGTSWRAPDSADKISYPKMKNGKCFAGFLRKGAYPVDYFEKYTPAYTSEACGKRYFAQDIKEMQDKTVYGIESDPVSGEETLFTCKINWPYMPIGVTNSGMVCPATMVFSLSQRCGLLMSGEKMYFSLYTHGFNSDATSKEDALLPHMDKYCVYIFESCDCGRTWNYLSQIPTNEEVMKQNPYAEGFCEPMMARLPDGSISILLRTGNNNPSFIARSTDDCKTWSKPTIFDSNGVLPQILTLESGVTLASYGRPILKIRATSDPSGIEWEKPIILPLTESTDPKESEKPWGKRQQSCFYTGLLAASENTAFLVYSDFHYPNPDGVQVKSILVRKIKVVFDD